MLEARSPVFHFVIAGSNFLSLQENARPIPNGRLLAGGGEARAT